MNVDSLISFVKGKIEALAMVIESQEKNQLTVELEAEKEIYRNLLTSLYVSKGRDKYFTELVNQVSDKPDEFMQYINNKIKEDIMNGTLMSDEMESATEDVQTEQEAEPQDVADEVEQPVDVSVPDVDAIMQETLNENNVAEPSEEPVAPVEVKKEDVHLEDELKQKERMRYHIAMFERDRFWNLNSKNEKINTTKKIAELSKGKINSAEISVMNAMGEDGLFLVDDILQASDAPIKAQAAIDSLAEKELVFYSGEAHNKVFMSKLGIWFYTIALRKNPKLFMNRHLQQFNYLSPSEAKAIGF